MWGKLNALKCVSIKQNKLRNKIKGGEVEKNHVEKERNHVERENRVERDANPGEREEKVVTVLTDPFFYF